MSCWLPGLVSIVMAAYNSERYVADAIASVVAQTFQDWELLVVDDGSTDRTLAIASDFAKDEPRIRVIHLDNNRGVANARNVGIAAARGRYLAFLDSDDLWLPPKLEIQIEFMKRTGAGFSFTQYRRLLQNGRLGREIKAPVAVSYRQLLHGNLIGCLTVVIDRSQIAAPKLKEVRHEDYVAWLSILREGHTAYGIQTDLARYRVSSGSVSGIKVRSASWTWNIFRNTEAMPFFAAVRCFWSYSLRAIINRIAG